MQTFLTTSTGPSLPVTFTDQQGNAVNVTGASFAMTFRCTTNFQKVGGSGSFSGTTQQLQAGLTTYTLGANDMANAYALYSVLIDRALFECYAKATISGVEYSALPIVIEIQKIWEEDIMGTFLDFQFLAILNLFVLLLWPASEPYAGDRRNAIGVIILILTIIAIVLDIFYLVLKFAH